MGGTEVGISSACSECYATTADYGFKNCKAACLLGWCKQGCLDCTAPARSIFQHALAFRLDPRHLAWRPQLSLALQMIRPQFRPWMTMPLVISPTNAVPVH